MVGDYQERFVLGLGAVPGVEDVGLARALGIVDDRAVAFRREDPREQAAAGLARADEQPRHHRPGRQALELLDRAGVRFADEELGLARLGHDERQSYQEALDRHYSEGAPDGWHSHWVSSYATMHPWEDWAETFAHYLHIRDTLQTAAAWGISVAGPAGGSGPSTGVVPMDTLEDETFTTVARDWAIVSAALNSLNRSMGHADLYPFDLPGPAVERLELVHRLVTDAGIRR